MTDQNAPAGWYPDGSGGNRWWDGTQWTEHFQAAQVTAPTPAPTPEPVFPAQFSTAQATQTAPAYSAAPAATATGPKEPVLVSDHISLAALAAASAVLVLIGSLTPWATYGDLSASGTDDGKDGVITLICALLAVGTVAATTFLVAGVPRIVAQWATVVLGLAVVVIAIIDIFDINDTDPLSVGWGLWLVLLAGIAVTVVGVLLALLRGHKH